MTFFGKARNTTLFDQQAFLRSEKQQSEKRRAGTVFVFRLVVVFIFLIIFLNLAFRLPSLYSKVTKPFDQIQSQFYSDNRLNFDKRANILLATFRAQKLQEIAIASFESGKRKIIVLKLTPQVKVYSAEGVKKLEDLVVYEKNAVKNIDQFSAALLEITGYSVDGYLIVQNSQNWLDLDSLNTLVEKTAFTPNFFFGLRDNKNYLDQHLLTNLDISEFYQLVSVAKKIVPERFEIVDITDYNNQEDFVDQQSLSNEIGVKLNDSEIVNGNYAVEIVNASSVEGLGLVLKRVVSNLGANVVQVSSAEEVQDKSLIVTSDNDSYLTTRLVRLLGGEIKTEKKLGSIDVKVILGKNFGKFLDY